MQTRANFLARDRFVSSARSKRIFHKKVLDLVEEKSGLCARGFTRASERVASEVQGRAPLASWQRRVVLNIVCFFLDNTIQLSTFTEL